MISASKKLAYAEGTASIILNTVLFILKYWVGILTGSVTIIADAWHTLSDSLTSIVVIAGAKISSKPADTEHPFGHGRAESIAAIIIGVLLFMVGLNFLFEAFDKLRNNQGATFTISAVIIFLISTILKEALAQFSFWSYRRTKLYSLKADGWHHRSDAIASAIILISIFLGRDLWWIDGVFGIIVSMLILYTAVGIIKEATHPILGKSPGPDMIKKIKKIASQHDLRDVHHIHEHCYGSHLEYTLHVCMPKAMPLQDAHAIVDAFRTDARNKLNLELTIYMEPSGVQESNRVVKYV